MNRAAALAMANRTQNLLSFIEYLTTPLLAVLVGTTSFRAKMQAAADHMFGNR